MIERVSLSQGGRVTSVDPATNTIVTDFGNYTAQVAKRDSAAKGRPPSPRSPARSTIPGWCPIDPVSFASKLVPDIHVVGDACFGGVIPKSASAAECARQKPAHEAVASLIAGKLPASPRLLGACYNTVAPGYAFSQVGVYQPRDGLFAESRGCRHKPGRMRRASCARVKPTRRRTGTRSSRWTPLARAAISMAGIWLAAALVLPGAATAQALRPYVVSGDTIAGTADGNAGRRPRRGRALILERTSTCILCHSGPFSGSKIPGRSRAQPCRRRPTAGRKASFGCGLVDASRLNPGTIMPSYYRIEGLVARRPSLARQADPFGGTNRGYGGLPHERCANRNAWDAQTRPIHAPASSSASPAAPPCSALSRS